jgi:hypothetical protein
MPNRSRNGLPLQLGALRVSGLHFYRFSDPPRTVKMSHHPSAKHRAARCCLQ